MFKRTFNLDEIWRRILILNLKRSSFSREDWFTDISKSLNISEGNSLNDIYLSDTAVDTDSAICSECEGLVAFDLYKYL